LKRVLCNSFVLLFLLFIIINTLCIPTFAAEKSSEIELLKIRLQQIEEMKNIELDELKQRIEALEKENKQQAEKVKEVGELKQSVGNLENKLEKNEKVLSGISGLVTDHKLKLGLKTQSWYQFVEDGTKDGDKDLHDFMFRRLYFSLKGEVIPNFGFFGHIAADRIGQDGLNNSGMGLGSGIAVRDAWIYYNFDEAFKVQMGRMYIPFTRSFGTESTFALLTLDLPFTQGGIRGAPFFTSKVGRDDGIVFWGNPLNGKLQYRLGISEGVENDDNPDDSLRYAGRVSFNLLEPETSWFNKGTYLGKKKVLAIGGGCDYQKDLTLDGKKDQNNLGWTIDLFFDHPVGGGAITAEAAYIDEKNVTQKLKYSWLAEGDDAQIYYIQGGYLLPGNIGPGRLQPYFRYERLNVEHRPDTSFPSIGLNYFLKGHNAKITLDWTMINQKKDFNAADSYSGDDQNLITLQVAAGF